MLDSEPESGTLLALVTVETPDFSPMLAFAVVIAEVAVKMSSDFMVQNLK